MNDAINKFFVKTVRAIVEAIIFDIDSDCDEQTVNEGVKFILSVYSSMQPLYRFGLVILAAIFSFYAMARTGRSFSRLSIDGRMRLMRIWLNSPIGIMRDFIRFFLTMTIMFYYDSDEALLSHGVDTKTHRKIQCFYAGN